jgi:outer membrane protein assembly factor BamB
MTPDGAGDGAIALDAARYTRHVAGAIEGGRQSARRRSFARAVLVMSCVAAGAAQDHGRDYPQWRGVNRDGAASAFAEPTTWPDALTRRWKVEVGEGYATPLVVGDTVYTFARRSSNEVMTALDAATGHERWHTGYEAPYEPDMLAAAHGEGPKATPLFHRGRLFSLGMTGIVSAFDAATGRLVWQVPADATHPTYGMSVSPVGEGELVIVTTWRTPPSSTTIGEA